MHEGNGEEHEGRSGGAHNGGSATGVNQRVGRLHSMERGDLAAAHNSHHRSSAHSNHSKPSTNGAWRGDHHGGGSRGRWRRGHYAILALALVGLLTFLLLLSRWYSTHPSALPSTAYSFRPPTLASVTPISGLKASMALLSSASSAPSVARRILLASFDIDGPNLNGGIGTASTALARVLARRHRVTLLHAAGNKTSPGSRYSWAEWTGVFRQQHGIELLALSLAPSHVYSSASYEMVRSYELMLWLIEHASAYDVVHIHDWRGLGYYTLLSAQQGHPALQRLAFVTVCHSQTLWSALGNNRPPDTDDALKTNFMERQAMRFSQYAVWPSRYFFDWMARHQYDFPQPHRRGSLVVMRNPIVLADGAQLHKETGAAMEVRELVFFGRLEERKGLDLFLDAAEQVQRRIDSGELRPQVAGGQVRFTLMGKLIPQSITPAMLRRVQSVQLLPGWRVLTNFSASDAVAYLRGQDGGADGRIAVMPSRIDNSPYTVQEALVHGIPFIASDVGGVPELIREADRARVTFLPNSRSLAERMAATLTTGFVPAAPAFDVEEDIDDWVEWHAALPSPPPRVAADSSPRPLVSVVMTTFNRTRYVLEALDSLRAQTYESSLLEVIVVNDGTSDAASLAYYDAVAASVGREPRWQYVVAAHNGGESAARNLGSERAHGAYLTFMDDDNLAHPEQIATFVRAAAHTGSDVLTCMAETFSGSSPHNVTAPSYVWVPLGPALSLSVWRNVIGDSNLFIRADVYRRFGGFGASVVAEDWELLTRLMLGGASIQLVPHVLLWKRSTQLSRLHVVESADNRMAVADAFLGADVSHELGLALLYGREAAKRQRLEQLHLANSAADFADRHGYKQWHYLRWEAEQQPPQRERLLAVRQRSADGTPGAIEWRNSNHRANQSACFVRARTQQPCLADGRSTAVARGWQATYDCVVLVSGALSVDAECGGAAVVVSVEVKPGVALFEAELRAGESVVVPGVEAAVRFNEFVVIATRLAASALEGGQQRSQQCNEVTVNVNIALKPRPAALW